MFIRKRKKKHFSRHKQAARKKWKAHCQEVKGYVTFSAHGGVNPKQEDRASVVFFLHIIGQKKHSAFIIHIIIHIWIKWIKWLVCTSFMVLYLAKGWRLWDPLVSAAWYLTLMNHANSFHLFSRLVFTEWPFKLLYLLHPLHPIWKNFKKRDLM